MAKKNKSIDDRLKVSEVQPDELRPDEISPAEETPAEETPAEETPVEEAPVEETPAEVPVEEKPGEEKPADQFNELLGKIEGAEAPPKTKRERKPVIEKTTRKKKKGESSPDSFRVEGYILMLVVDTVFPFAFSTINNMLDKRIKIQSYDLALNDKDFKKLEPLADQAADYMAVNLNPIAGFFLVATFMYGNNVINLRMQVENNLKSGL
jgi:hypothetical protein